MSLHESLPAPPNTLLLIPWYWRPENTLVRAGPRVPMDETWELSVQRLPPLRTFPPGLLSHLGLVRLLESGLRVSGVSSVYQQKGPPLTPEAEVLATEKHCP